MPFYHIGMHELLPIGAKLPRVGRRIKVLFGEPTVADAAFRERCLGTAEALAHDTSTPENEDRLLRSALLRWCEAELQQLEGTLLSGQEAASKPLM